MVSFVTEGNLDRVRRHDGPCHAVLKREEMRCEERLAQYSNATNRSLGVRGSGLLLLETLCEAVLGCESWYSRHVLHEVDSNGS